MLKALLPILVLAKHACMADGVEQAFTLSGIGGVWKGAHKP